MTGWSDWYPARDLRQWRALFHSYPDHQQRRPWHYYAASFEAGADCSRWKFPLPASGIRTAESGAPPPQDMILLASSPTRNAADISVAELAFTRPTEGTGDMGFIRNDAGDMIPPFGGEGFVDGGDPQ